MRCVFRPSDQVFCHRSFSQTAQYCTKKVLYTIRNTIGQSNPGTGHCPRFVAVLFQPSTSRTHTNLDESADVWASTVAFFLRTVSVTQVYCTCIHRLPYPAFPSGPQYSVLPHTLYLHSADRKAISDIGYLERVQSSSFTAALAGLSLTRKPLAAIPTYLYLLRRERRLYDRTISFTAYASKASVHANPFHACFAWQCTCGIWEISPLVARLRRGT